MLTQLSPEGLRVPNIPTDTSMFLDLEGVIYVHSSPQNYPLYDFLRNVFEECGFLIGLHLEGFKRTPRFYLTHQRVQEFSLAFSFSYSNDTQTLTLMARNTIPWDSATFTRLLPLDSFRNVLGDVLALVRQCWAERA